MLEMTISSTSASVFPDYITLISVFLHIGSQTCSRRSISQYFLPNFDLLLMFRSGKVFPWLLRQVIKPPLKVVWIMFMIDAVSAEGVD